MRREWLNVATLTFMTLVNGMRVSSPRFFTSRSSPASYTSSASWPNGLRNRKNRKTPMTQGPMKKAGSSRGERCTSPIAMMSAGTPTQNSGNSRLLHTVSREETRVMVDAVAPAPAFAHRPSA
jgi:hypothetical protein